VTSRTRSAVRSPEISDISSSTVVQRGCQSGRSTSDERASAKKMRARRDGKRSSIDESSSP
jgi:hypothetical protein